MTDQMKTQLYPYEPGRSYPSGIKLDSNGVNFSIFTRHASSVELLLFEQADSKQPFQIISLDKTTNRTFYSWHIFVKGLKAGFWYNWRIDGAIEPKEAGWHFDKEKALIDPWSKAVSDHLWDREAARQQGSNLEKSMRCAITDETNYDWEGDTPLSISSKNSIIYELHVGGYTLDPSSKVKNPGTFSGLIEKIPYLKKLGITHVELLPIMAFDEQDVPVGTAALGLSNYWGYSTHSFFSPHPGYCVTPEQGTHIKEFRDLVKAFHKAKIGVILDVVFNHTSESGIDGPVINFRGMGENIYYHHDHHDKSQLKDFTGCGNTVNANHPWVSAFITNCLEYWVRDMHVDGFRFDLASALCRGEGGAVLEDPPVLWGIELSQQLAQTKLIAEAWDAAGLYQVGSFPGHRWAEWNGKYRDTVREVLRGERGKIAELATRISGSSDLYEHQSGLPTNSINFVTCHDGFTMLDLFSYNEKHNEANGENSRDGCNNNLSSNAGVEGPTELPHIQAFRSKQVKNAQAILLFSQGVPMLLAGDELLNTQNGNNNGYCQNNALTWIDWNLGQAKKEVLRFVRLMIQLRKRHNSIMRRRFLTSETVGERGLIDISWYDPQLQTPDWNDHNARFLAFTLAGLSEDETDLFIVINFSDEKINVDLPQIQGRLWQLAVNTDATSPNDIIEPKAQIPYRENSFLVSEKSIVIFENSNQ